MLGAAQVSSDAEGVEGAAGQGANPPKEVVRTPSGLVLRGALEGGSDREVMRGWLSCPP